MTARCAGRTCDVLVAGAGLPGSALAVALAQHGLVVELVDPSRPRTVARSVKDLHSIGLRVSALSPASVNLLELTGVWPRIPRSVACPFASMEVWDRDGTGRIDFSAEDIPLPELGFIIENDRLLDVLRTCADERPTLLARYGRRVEAIEESGVEGCRVRLDDGSLVCCGLLVGADGANSQVRNLAGIGTVIQDCGQSAIVCNVRTELTHRKTAWQCFQSSGPLAFLPLPHFGDDRYCSIVWSADYPVANVLLKLDDEAFAEALGNALEFKLGEVIAVSKRRSFPLRQQHARTYAKQGIVLIADAAHAIHPLAGQGLNLGLTDVRVLIEECQRAQTRHLPLGSLEVLSRYQRRRRGQNKAMIDAMRGFQLLFADKRVPVRLARNLGLTGVAALPSLKRLFMRQALGL